MNTSPARKVLVVDDEVLIAMLVADMLSDIGCEPVGPACNIDEALSMATNSDFDCALLDLNLNGLPVFPVADVLRTRNIPFAFASGAAESGLSATYADVPVLHKPFDAHDVAAMIDIIAGGARHPGLVSG
jgi:CheY-like chemotaxis protein